jgi:hypothetical protein
MSFSLLAGQIQAKAYSFQGPLFQACPRQRRIRAISKPVFAGETMSNTTLSTDPLTLLHVLITLIAIASGFVVLAEMRRSTLSSGWTGTFLATTLLTTVTGYIFFHPPNPPTPAQLTGVVALLVLAPTLYALYLKHLAGVWRPVYVIGVVISLYLNVFVLVVQLFLKVPKPAITGGPVFGAVQGIVLIAFVIAGWRGVKGFHPTGA